jgi:hypothetical protein
MVLFVRYDQDHYAGHNIGRAWRHLTNKFPHSSLHGKELPVVFHFQFFGCGSVPTFGH